MRLHIGKRSRSPVGPIAKFSNPCHLEISQSHFSNRLAEDRTKDGFQRRVMWNPIFHCWERLGPSGWFVDRILVQRQKSSAPVKRMLTPSDQRCNVAPDPEQVIPRT